MNACFSIVVSDFCVFEARSVTPSSAIGAE
jgi:hypothetical protein